MNWSEETYETDERWKEVQKLEAAGKHAEARKLRAEINYDWSE